MILQQAIFYLLATILLIAALGVVTAKNPVHAVLSLVLTFATSSCLWLMLNVEFLALVLILVYVGAVMVLFLFVVMMLDIDIEQLRKGFWRNLPLALILGMVIEIEMILVLVTKPINLLPVHEIQHSTLNTSMSNSYQLGLIMYQEFSYPVELASLLLLLGLVAAVALTLHHRSTKRGKYQNIAKQVMVNAKDRVKLIK